MPIETPPPARQTLPSPRVISYHRITTDHPLYPQELALRESVIFAPLGYSMARFQADFPGFEDRFEHFIAVFNHPSGPRVVGCCTLLPDVPRPGSGKLMQMAVDPQRHGEGIGKRLVIEVERRAFAELRLTELFCHAPHFAGGFYHNLGWTYDGPEFTEAGAPHRKMVFRPPAEE